MKLQYVLIIIVLFASAVLGGLICHLCVNSGTVPICVCVCMHYAKSRQVAGSIPDGVIGIFQ
jgi:hypothetical protein